MSLKSICDTIGLSGGDGDGSLGLTAIKAAGGVTFAQCEETAQVDSMRHTARATGNVDFVLPPAKIAEAMANLSRNPMLVRPLLLIDPEAAPQPGDALTNIFPLLRSTTGVDFSHYKLNTIERRMQRRLLLCNLEQLDDYVTYLSLSESVSCLRSGSSFMSFTLAISLVLSTPQLSNYFC